ncbi:MAG: hypothetical protein R2939_04590 [Kofleriaceae bacterium]
MRWGTVGWSGCVLTATTVGASARPSVELSVDVGGDATVGEGRVDEFNLVDRGPRLGVGAGLRLRHVTPLLRVQAGRLSADVDGVTLLGVGPGVRVPLELTPRLAVHGELDLGLALGLPGEPVGAWVGLGAYARVAGGVIGWLRPGVGLGAEVAATRWHYGYESRCCFGPTTLGAALTLTVVTGGS